MHWRIRISNSLKKSSTFNQKHLQIFKKLQQSKHISFCRKLSKHVSFCINFFSRSSFKKDFPKVVQAALKKVKIEILGKRWEFPHFCSNGLLHIRWIKTVAILVLRSIEKMSKSTSYWVRIYLFLWSSRESLLSQSFSFSTKNMKIVTSMNYDTMLSVVDHFNHKLKLLKDTTFVYFFIWFFKI